MRGGSRAGRLVLALCSTAAALVALEWAYRTFVEPRVAGGQVRPLSWDQPVVVEPDPALGWRNRPGVYRLGFGHAARRRVALTSIEPDGTRSNGRHALAPAVASRPEVAAIGCSFTYGWGVDDDATYAALAARKRPDLRVVNLASPGYGTYQALLALQRYYEGRPPPRGVVYGLSAHHAERNVATLRWRYMLWLFGQRGTVAVPFVSTDGQGGLVFNPPERFQFPALVRPSHALSRYWLWAAMRLDSRPPQAQAAMRALLDRLDDWTAARGAALVVAVLDRTPSPWTDELRARRIPFVEARAWRMLPDDTHPDWAFHRDVAARLLGALSRIALAPGGTG